MTENNEPPTFFIKLQLQTDLKEYISGSYNYNYDKTRHSGFEINTIEGRLR